MPETPLTREQRIQCFADETDAINLRSQIEEPASEEEIAAIFAAHRAECDILAADARPPKRPRIVRRV